MNTFEQALAQEVPALIERYETYVIRNVERFIAEKATTITMGKTATGKYVRPYTVFDGTRMTSVAIGVKTEWLRKMATLAAEGAVADYTAKLVRKLGDNGNWQVARVGNGSFTITGEVNGHKVAVEQQVVFKISSKGTPFNQFPARIYVDGKFTPEKEYEEAVA